MRTELTRSVRPAPSDSHRESTHLVGRSTLQLLQQQMRKYPRLPSKELATLLRQAQGNDLAARNKVILHNLGLVYFVVRRHAGASPQVTDLIQEGVFGLMDAIDRFDHRPDTSFGTFAMWCIRGAMSHHFRKIGPLVHIPTNVNNYVVRLRKRLRMHPDESAEEAITAFGLSPSEARNVLHAFRQSTVSLNHSAQDIESSGPQFQDTLRSVSGLDPEQAALARSLYQEARDELRDLYTAVTNHPKIDPRNAEIFAKKLGLADNYVGRTLESIGSEYGITRERVRQIVARSWLRLRKSTSLTEDTFSAAVERFRNLEDLVNL